MNFSLKKALLSGWRVTLATFNGFLDDRGLKLSASLAYYTVFSLAPLMMLLVFVLSLYFGHDAFEGKIYPELKGFVGPDAATQIQSIVKSVQLGKSAVAIIIGVVTLIIGATGIFMEIQDSLNIIWRVKAKPKRGWVKMITNRLLSFSLVIALGFLLLVSLIVNGLLAALSDKLSHYLSHFEIVFYVINTAVTFIVIAALFGIIFKYLPDVKIRWRDVRTGAVFTALLFMLGKYLIGLYIGTMKISSTYGAAGSIIIIFVWIYYTSALLYLGAEFTQVYAEFTGCKIEPADYAVAIEQKEIERDVSTLPLQNPGLKR
ncbi:membrane protein [Mucilaginibacter gracilis]|uniref:Membrane protein n=1 Tax=Mucilaginibacter gracilis TaxID=423350 RepID=A0A495IYY1_9SPHI|nr:YihY/virulence factor BrkB family protein [Mucilaginibacter gracilis]RKR81288.1 membrane protein [Mucilaginibacter gracilis]